MTGFATVTSKNQITLPVDLVRLLNWPAGTELWVKDEDERMILEKILSLEEIRKGLLSNQKVRKINRKFSSVEIIRMARRAKPPRHVYDN